MRVVLRFWLALETALPVFVVKIVKKVDGYI